MKNCKQWFEQGNKFGRLFVYWRQIEKRLLWDYVPQEMLDEIEKEVNLLRRKVLAKHFSKSQIDCVAKEIDNLELKIRQLHRF